MPLVDLFSPLELNTSYPRPSVPPFMHRPDRRFASRNEGFAISPMPFPLKPDTMSVGCAIA